MTYMDSSKAFSLKLVKLTTEGRFLQIFGGAGPECAVTAYGRTAVSGRDVATRRRPRAAQAAVDCVACSRTYIVDRPLTFVTVV